MSRTAKDAIGRLGPAVNLRPAGAHLEKLRHGSRQQVRQALRSGQGWE